MEARIPLGRYGATDEMGRVAAFLLSPAASYVTGAIVPVDGGMVRALPERVAGESTRGPTSTLP